MKAEKVKHRSNNLKISKTKKNNPTPRANKRAIYCVPPWVELEATLLQQSPHYSHRIMPMYQCRVCSINLEFKSEYVRREWCFKPSSRVKSNMVSKTQTKAKCPLSKTMIQTKAYCTKFCLYKTTFNRQGHISIMEGYVSRITQQLTCDSKCYSYLWTGKIHQIKKKKPSIFTHCS